MSAAEIQSGIQDGAPGPRNSICDVAGIRVGSAQDDDLRTGVTVVLPDAAATAAVDVRGGGPGTRETEALSPEASVRAAHAVVLSGGSALGLGAGDAVAAALSAQGRGLEVRPGHPRVPIVPTAILYDLRAEAAEAYAAEGAPHPALARAALSAAQDEGGGEVAEGSVGAGRGAHAGRLKGGLGTSSSWVREGFEAAPATVGALVASNPVGSVCLPGSRAFWAWPLERRLEDGWEFGGLRPDGEGMGAAGTWAPLPAEGRLGGAAAEALGASTMIAVVATDAALSSGEARRVAMMAHDGFARAVRPAHTPFDGDTIFVLSTGRLAARPASPLAVAALGSAAADAIARAVARGVRAAAADPGGAPAWGDLAADVASPLASPEPGG